MGVQFTVDYRALDEMAGQLMGLTCEFDGLEDVVEGYQAAVGHDRLADRLDSFASNWSDERRKMKESMEAVAGYADAAADAYRDTEGQLCDAFEQADAQVTSGGDGN
ncbi:MAG: hypothetical protein ACRD29_22405 [Acidimicrobiales bacterium]